jgi:hypothetical protein
MSYWDEILSCEKCEKEFKRANLNIVAPVDRNGRTLGWVFLCKGCRKKWHKVAERANIKTDKDFHGNWARLWQKFLKGKFDNGEKVEFT